MEKENEIKEIRKTIFELRKYKNIADYPQQIELTIRFYEDKLNKLLKEV